MAIQSARQGTSMVMAEDDILIGAARANSSNGEVYLISGETLDLAADGTGVQTPGVIDLALDLGL